MTRPRYKPESTASDGQPVEMIGHYDFDKEVACGLTSCHRRHKQGLLVVMESGAEINIGWICGTNHFPHVDFKGMKKKVDSALQILRQRELLREYVAASEDAIRRVHALINQPQSIEWICRGVKSFNATYPRQVVDKVRHKAHVGTLLLSEERERTPQEFELAKAANPTEKSAKLRYTTETRGILVGLEVFASHPGFAAYALKDTLQQLRSLEIEQLSAHKLAEWARRGAGTEQSIASIQELINCGRQFFAPENMALLTHLVMNPNLRREVSLIEWDYEAARGTKKTEYALSEDYDEL